MAVNIPQFHPLNLGLSSMLGAVGQGASSLHQALVQQALMEYQKNEMHNRLAMGLATSGDPKIRELGIAMLTNPKGGRKVVDLHPQFNPEDENSQHIPGLAASLRPQVPPIQGPAAGLRAGSLTPGGMGPTPGATMGNNPYGPPSGGQIMGGGPPPMVPPGLGLQQGSLSLPPTSPTQQQ